MLGRCPGGGNGEGPPPARLSLPRTGPLCQSQLPRGWAACERECGLCLTFLGPEECAPLSSALCLSQKLEAAPLTQACIIPQPSAHRWRRPSQPSWRAFSLRRSWSAGALPAAPGHLNFLTERGNQKFMHWEYRI